MPLPMPEPTARQDLTINKGADFEWTIQWLPGGEVVDLTGATARMKVKQRLSDTVPILELTTANGRIELGGVEGTIRLLLSEIETENLDFEIANYDLEIVFPVNEVFRLIEGKIYAAPEVTT